VVVEESCEGVFLFLFFFFFFFFEAGGGRGGGCSVDRYHVLEPGAVGFEFGVVVFEFR